MICQAASALARLRRRRGRESSIGCNVSLQRVGGNVDNTCCVLYWCITSVTTQREVANFRPSRKTLVQHNVPVIAIASNRRHRSSRTRVCKEILFADTGTEEFIQVLEMLGPKLNQKAVLFPCYDESVLLVSRFRQRLEKWYQVILPSPEIVEMLTDKIRFYTFAREKGLPVPRSFFLYCRADAEQAAICQLGAKPEIGKTEGAGPPTSCVHINVAESLQSL